jgi:hypothetical protein
MQTSDPLKSNRSEEGRATIDSYALGYGVEDFELAPADDDEDWEQESGWPARIGATAFWTLRRVAWIGLAAVLAFGSAGLVAATGRSPDNDGRPELTYAADQSLSDRLDAGVTSLNRLNQDVIYLGDLTRDVLSDVSQLNKTRLASDYQDGDSTVKSIDEGAAALSATLECTPWPDSRDVELGLKYSQAMIDRWHQVCDALDSVQPLASDWAAMVAGSKVVTQVTDDINKHDAAAATALQLGTAGRYPEALSQMATADQWLADAQRIDTTMAKTADVSTLTDWLSRTKNMDDALVLLWQTMVASKGRVTPQVTAALKAVNVAKALLPDDNSILQVVIYELTGGLTAHGLSIETAKGQFGAAISGLTDTPVGGG